MRTVALLLQSKLELEDLRRGLEPLDLAILLDDLVLERLVLLAQPLLVAALTTAAADQKHERERKAERTPHFADDEDVALAEADAAPSPDVALDADELDEAGAPFDEDDAADAEALVRDDADADADGARSR